jgi:Domain of unknown function (DUF4192)
MSAHAVPTRGRRRAQQALEDAELRFVARVVADGDIGPWRAAAEPRLRAARESFARYGRLARGVGATLVVALADQPTRDRCWRAIESQPDPGWPDFWLHVSRRALPPYRAEPLFLLAWSAWRLDDVRLARAAAGEALTEDPGHRAAAMLLAMLDAGVRPGRLPSLADRPGTVVSAS